MRILHVFIVSLAVLLLSGCTSYKNVAYLQDGNAMNELSEPLSMYDAKIMPKDLLTITVNATDPETAAPFNLTVQTAVNVTRSSSLAQQAALQQYLVSNEGTIDFPVLGVLNVGGLTKTEAENLIRTKLGNYLKEIPIVTVRMANYKISVLGEVARPGMFTVSNEKISVFEALALAGDLTIWGMRDNVKIIREDADGQREIISLNLNKTDIVNSPYYYLQQNDILYVTPNKTKAKNSDIGQSTSLWFSGTSILVSLVNIIITFFVLK
ncbi:MAG: polysaccharide biosynthesis/export family protein [Bacteroidales bacterium]|nr:polysaccharide biosynthesis/export family protein [Bacteroidales bacterium]